MSESDHSANVALAPVPGDNQLSLKVPVVPVVTDAKPNSEPNVELNAEPGVPCVDDVDYAQLGKATVRLVHDFKNQLGGLKLYASFLKTKLSNDPDAADIVSKIVQGLDSMADNATLVARLARPVEFRAEPGDLVALIRKVIAEQQWAADARPVKFNVSLPAAAPEISFDWQQLKRVLEIVIQRAVNVTPASGVCQIRLQENDGLAIIGVTDQGSPLNEVQRQQFFSLLTNERLNKTALDLAYAARVMKAHGGWAAVSQAGNDATLVELVLKSQT